MRLNIQHLEVVRTNVHQVLNFCVSAVPVYNMRESERLIGGHPVTLARLDQGACRNLK